MAAAPGSRLEKLTHTKKYAAWVASGDLYALPVTAVPGCGFLLGFLLKRKGISRASDLYEVYTKKKKNFLKYLCCKFGPWNIVYAKTVVQAYKDWEEAHVPMKEKTVKKEAPEKKKGPPRKLGPGSKKWDAFLKRKDLKKTSVKLVPGIATILGEQLFKIGYRTADQLMDQYKGNKDGQCNKNDEAFHKWILCCFGYWNTQYCKVVLDALKAFDAVSHGGTGTEANDNQGETFGQMVVRVAEDTAEKVSDALEKGSAEGGSAGGAAEANDNQGDKFGNSGGKAPISPEARQFIERSPIEDSSGLEEAPAELEETTGGSEANDNQGKSFADFVTRMAEKTVDAVASALEENGNQDEGGNSQVADVLAAEVEQIDDGQEQSDDNQEQSAKKEQSLG